MKIRTEHVYPPIPSRSTDWCAYDEDTYDGAEDSHPIVGWGPTQAAARADFMDLWLQHEAEREMKAAAKSAQVWDSIFDRLLGKLT